MHAAVPRPDRRKVLIVDDEPVITDTLSAILRAGGFDATGVYSGQSAVDTARTLRPDILVSDIIMEGVNGLEAAIQIRKLLPRCRIILISGAPLNSELVGDARRRGHEFEMLAKPFHPKTLLSKLNA